MTGDRRERAVAAGAPEAPRYRMLAAAEAERLIPASSNLRSVAKAAAWLAGRGNVPPAALQRALGRLGRDPRRRSLRLEFAEGRFGADLVVEIDPLRLGTMLADAVGEGRRALRLAHWFLDAGDWTDAIVPLRVSEVDHEIAALFEPRPIEATAAHARMVERMRAGVPEIRNGVALATPALIANYFDYYRALAESIRTHGFRRRGQLPAEAGQPFAASPVRGRGAEVREREIGIAVAADGSVLRVVGGRHRTAIAQRLGLRRIPVQVRLVHARWLAAEVARSGLPAEEALLAGIRALQG